MRVKALERERIRREEGRNTRPKDAIERATKTRQKRIDAGLINPYSEERNKKMAESKRGKVRKYLPSGKYIMVNPPKELTGADVLF